LSCERISVAKRHIIYGSLVRSADFDYINARFAHFNIIPHLFWWSASQAVEKYMKSILLVNDQSVVGCGHKLLKMLGKLSDVGIELSGQELISGYREIGFDKISLQIFLKRIYEYGSPDCRYGLDGSDFDWHDLFYLDQLVFKLRRCIVPLKEEIDDDSCTFLEWLAKNPNSYYSKSGKIWEIINDKDHKLNTYACDLNSTFLPNKVWQNGRLFACGRMGPIQEALLKNFSDGQEDNHCKSEILNWLLKDWEMSKPEKNEVSEFLKQVSD
jgi:hypothetical protein